jgi:hypothetical protein
MSTVLEPFPLSSPSPDTARTNRLTPRSLDTARTTRLTLGQPDLFITLSTVDSTSSRLLPFPLSLFWDELLVPTN